MLGRYWLHNAAVRGCLIAAFLLIPSTPYAQGVGDAPRDKTSAAESKQEPQAEVGPVPGSAFEDAVYRIAAALEAIATQGEPADKAERDESDLRAQWAMAKWAKWMFAATAASVALTFVGIFLIWRTLVYTKRAVEEAAKVTKFSSDAVEETRTANKIAAKAAKDAAAAVRETVVAADRAWIAVDAALNGPLVLDANGQIKVEIKITLKNIGKSPATQVMYGCSLHPNIFTADDAAKKFFNSAQGSRNYINFINYGKVLLPGDTESAATDTEISAEQFRAAIQEILDSGDENVARSIERGDTIYTHSRPSFFVGVRYRLPGDDTFRITALLYEIEHRRPDHPGFNGTETETIAAHDLRLETGFVSGRIT